MLNKSDIVIKQGSHKKSVPKFCATRWTAIIDTLSHSFTRDPGRGVNFTTYLGDGHNT